MEELVAIIKQLQQGIQVLVKQDASAHKKNVSLEKENYRLLQLLEAKENELLLVKQKLDGAFASTLFTGTQEKEALKKTVAKYLSEIDKCLSLLNTK